MSQLKNPHPKLVECRNAVGQVLGVTRNEAAAICNRLTDRDVESVLAAGEDAAKVYAAVEDKEPPGQGPAEVASKSEPKETKAKK